MLSVTPVVSLAVPVNEGVALLDGDLGDVMLTVGALVSRMKVTGALVPSGFPRSALFWIATAVKLCLPAASAGLTGPELHTPPAGVAVASATTVPVGRSPS